MLLAALLTVANWLPTRADVPSVMEYSREKHLPFYGYKCLTEPARLPAGIWPGHPSASPV